MPKQKASETRFLSILLDLGGILAFQSGAKTIKNRCWKGIKIWSFFEGLLERDFFGPRAAKTRKRRSQKVGLAECAGRLGRIKEG